MRELRAVFSLPNREFFGTPFAIWKTTSITGEVSNEGHYLFGAGWLP